MEPFRVHRFVCTQQKPVGIPSCPACGSFAVLDVMDREIQAFLQYSLPGGKFWDALNREIGERSQNQNKGTRPSAARAAKRERL
jgi:hypothetical protein